VGTFHERFEIGQRIWPALRSPTGWSPEGFVVSRRDRACCVTDKTRWRKKNSGSAVDVGESPERQVMQQKWGLAVKMGVMSLRDVARGGHVGVSSGCNFAELGELVAMERA